MDISERNRRVALSRWSKVHSFERNNISNNSKAIYWKAAICGFLAGDGSVQVRKEKNFFHYQLDFFPDDKIMLRTYMEAIKYLYKRVPSVRIRDNVFAVRLTSKVVIQDLLKSASFGLTNWNLPKELFIIKGAKEAWLKAFFSAEGYVGKKVIKLQTVNIKGMNSVSALLTEMNIEHNYYQYASKNKNHSPVDMIFITKKNARKIFYEKIGFWHSRKNKLLRKSLNL